MLSKRLLVLVAMVGAVHGFAVPRVVQAIGNSRLNSRSSVDFCNEVDYTSCINEMVDLFETTRENLNRIKELAEAVKNLEMEDQYLGEVMGTTEQAMALRLQVAEAKLAVDNKYDHIYEGPHDYNTVVDSRILDDTVNAIKRLEALQLFIRVEQARLKDATDIVHP